MSEAMASVMTERQLLEVVLRLAATLGWLTYHTHDSRRSQPGFPDLVLVRGSVILYRELKTERGKIGPVQQVWLDRLRGAGADAGIWRPNSWFLGVIEEELTRG